METIKIIKASPVYKQVMADSFCGIMYNVDNRDKYQADAILALWASMTYAERESADGIMKGAIDFLEGAI
jgi:hypothetical protein